MHKQKKERKTYDQPVDSIFCLYLKVLFVFSQRKQNNSNQ
jgi:hypothetical protein